VGSARTPLSKNIGYSAPSYHCSEIWGYEKGKGERSRGGGRGGRIGKWRKGEGRWEMKRKSALFSQV